MAKKVEPDIFSKVRESMGTPTYDDEYTGIQLNERLCMTRSRANRDRFFIMDSSGAEFCVFKAHSIPPGSEPSTTLCIVGTQDTRQIFHSWDMSETTTIPEFCQEVRIGATKAMLLMESK